MAMSILAKRYTYCNDGYGRYRCDTAWNNWIRWVVLAVVIVVFFLLFVGLSCLSARRRRRLGRQPIYGTRWAAYNYNPPTYQQSQQQPYYTPHYSQPGNYNPAPAYTPGGNGPQAYPQQPQQTGNSNAGYYNRDVEMQPPSSTYQSPYSQGQQDGVYLPPSGAPPRKN